MGSRRHRCRPNASKEINGAGAASGSMPAGDRDPVSLAPNKRRRCAPDQVGNSHGTASFLKATCRVALDHKRDPLLINRPRPHRCVKKGREDTSRLCVCQVLDSAKRWDAGSISAPGKLSVWGASVCAQSLCCTVRVKIAGMDLPARLAALGTRS
jgi:hypothetical protein